LSTAARGRTGATVALRVALYAVWTAVAGWLWLAAGPVLMERGCWQGEWPFERGCDHYPTRTLSKTTPGDYERYLARNLGDARAWTPYAAKLWADQDAKAKAVLAEVLKIHPYSPDLLRLEVAAANQAGDAARLAAALVHLAERGVADAYAPLLALMHNPDTQGHVLALLTPETRWLNVVFGQPTAALGPAALTPFVAEGLKLAILKPATVVALVEHLKKVGLPIDAYTLWMTLKGPVNEGLFNKGFDQRSQQKGFDWIWPQPAANALVGSRVAQVSATPRPGQMLEVSLTGKTGLPPVLVQQTLVLLQNRYRLTIGVSSDNLKTEEGLVWALYCAGGDRRWAHSVPLKSTQGAWRSFNLDFEVPAECGGVVDLRLEPAASWEVKAGMGGVVYFDDFDLIALTQGARGD
jgi:hypothetical protein